METNILCSIHLYWAYQIYKRNKTLEIRKSKPIYPANVYLYISKNSYKDLDKIPEKDREMCKKWIGKVPFKFTLNEVEDFSKWEYDYGALVRHLDLFAGTKGDYPFLNNYLKWQKKGYAWHIDNLKIYNTPKELSEFRKDLDCDDYPCNKNRDCKYNYYDTSEGCWACGIDFDGTNCIYKQIKRPPQSWYYVEELEKVKEYWLKHEDVSYFIDNQIKQLKEKK